MTQSIDERTLEQWANFDFSRQREEELQSAENPNDEITIHSTDERGVEESIESTTEQAVESDDLPPTPAYHGLEIPVGETPIYKRPHMKALVFGSVALLVALALGAVFAKGSNLQLGTPAEPSKSVAKKTEKTETEMNQEKMGQLEGEVAFGTLKNRQQLLEEQKKQKVLSQKLADQGEQNPGNPSNSNTVSIPPRPVSSAPTFVDSPGGLPRQTVSLASRSAPPAISSNSGVTSPTPIIPSTVLPASQPRIPAAIPSQPVKPPTLQSFGQMPPEEVASSVSSPSKDSSGYQPVTQRQTGEKSVSTNLMLAQQEEAFLSGKSQFLVESGTQIGGKVKQQVIADQDAFFAVQTQEDILGVPAGSEFIAQVSQYIDGYIQAEAVALRHPDGSETILSPGAVTITNTNGNLLKAKSNKGFFQKGFGKSLLNAGVGIADQYLSQPERIFRDDDRTTITRGGGNKDLLSLGGSALRSFADPLLNEASSDSGPALFLNPGQPVQVNVNAPFVVTQ
jgi:hypothetical protein